VLSGDNFYPAKKTRQVRVKATTGKCNHVVVDFILVMADGTEDVLVGAESDVVGVGSFDAERFACWHRRLGARRRVIS
jgi:hypothetical protein